MSFDPNELRTIDDPWARYDELRAEGPVVPLEGRFVGVFDHANADRVLRDARFTSSPIGMAYAGSLPPGALHDEMTRRINFLDPPDHPRVRRLVSTAFTPKRVDALRPWVTETASSLLGSLEVDDGQVELMHGFAHQVPSLVISELLGVPVVDRDRLTALSDAVTPIFGTRLDPAEKAIAIDAAEEMHAYFRALADRRRGDPGDDLLSALVHAEDAGDRLSSAELLSLVATLYSAGHRTTRDLVGNGLDLVLRAGHRLDEWDPAVVVEEILRMVTPTHFVARVPQEPVQLGGVTIDGWQPVLVFLAAANRDPAVYDDPHELRPGRDGPTSLSFAFGAHYCLGASLARMEAAEMIAAVVRRWPDLAIGDQPRRWHQRGPFRGLDELVVRIT